MCVCESVSSSVNASMCARMSLAYGVCMELCVTVIVCVCKTHTHTQTRTPSPKQATHTHTSLTRKQPTHSHTHFLTRKQHTHLHTHFLTRKATHTHTHTHTDRTFPPQHIHEPSRAHAFTTNTRPCTHRARAHIQTQRGSRTDQILEEADTHHPTTDTESGTDIDTRTGLLKTVLHICSGHTHTRKGKVACVLACV